MTYIKGSSDANTSKYFLCANDGDKRVPIMKQQTTPCMFSNHGCFTGDAPSLQRTKSVQLSSSGALDIEVMPLIEMSDLNKRYYVSLAGQVICYDNNGDETLIDIDRKLYLPEHQRTFVSVYDILYDDETKQLIIRTSEEDVIVSIPYYNTVEVDYDISLCFADTSDMRVFTDMLLVSQLANDDSGCCLYVPSIETSELYYTNSYGTVVYGPIKISSLQTIDDHRVSLGAILQVLPHNVHHVVFQTTPATAVVFDVPYVNVTKSVCFELESSSVGVARYFKSGYMTATCDTSKNFLNTGHIPIKCLCNGPDGWCISAESVSDSSLIKVAFYDNDGKYIVGMSYEDINECLTQKQLLEFVSFYRNAVSVVVNFSGTSTVSNSDVVYVYRTAIDGTTSYTVQASNGNGLAVSTDTIDVNTDETVSENDGWINLQFNLSSTPGSVYHSPLEFVTEEGLAMWNEALRELPIFFGSEPPNGYDVYDEEYPTDVTPSYVQFGLDANKVLIYVDDADDPCWTWPIEGTPTHSGNAYWFIADSTAKVPSSFRQWLYANSRSEGHYHDVSYKLFYIQEEFPSWIESDDQVYIERIPCGYYTVEFTDDPEGSIGYSDLGYVHLGDWCGSITIMAYWGRDWPIVQIGVGNGSENWHAFPEYTFIPPETGYDGGPGSYFWQYAIFHDIYPNTCEFNISTTHSSADVKLTYVFKGSQETVTIPEGRSNFTVVVDCNTPMLWECSQGLYFTGSPWGNNLSLDSPAELTSPATANTRYQVSFDNS